MEKKKNQTKKNIANNYVCKEKGNESESETKKPSKIAEICA